MKKFKKKFIFALIPITGFLIGSTIPVIFFNCSPDTVFINFIILSVGYLTCFLQNNL